MNNLLHISGNAYPTLHDKHHHTKNIWKELAQGFDEYHILARSQSNKYSYSKEKNIHLHLIPKITEKSKIYFFTSVWMFWVIRKYKITHLLAQCAIAGGFSGVLASKLFNIPLMTEIHGDVYFNFLNGKSWTDKVLSLIVKYTYKNSSKVRSLSSSMTDLLKLHGIEKNVVIIPNRVNLELFKTKKEVFTLNSPIRIVSIGRFVDQKGYDIAIQAVKAISIEQRVELFLIGGGKLLQDLKILKVDSKNIHLIEWIDQKDLRELLENSDIYIQPSKPGLGEAMPRTILEAMAMKLPVIATKIAAIPGILNHYNSILVNPGSIEELQEAIIKLIQDDLLRERIALQGYKDVLENYEWNNVFKLYRNEILQMKNL